MVLTASRLTIAATALALLWPAAAGAQSSPITWSEPVPLGEDLVSSWFPDIHTDAYGDVYLTWESVRDPGDPLVSDANGGALMLSQLRDGQWTEPADIYVKDIYNAARPILASDEDYLHLLSRSPRNEGGLTVQTHALGYAYVVCNQVRAESGHHVI
jgi:hypothetical protein